MSNNGSGHAGPIIGPVQILELTIEEGFDKERQKKCPVGKVPDGRRVLFGRVYHRLLRKKEVWSVRVEEDHANYIKVVPIKRISASPDGESGKMARLPESVVNLMKEALSSKIEQSGRLVEKAKAETVPLLAKKERFEVEKRELEAKIDILEQSIYSLNSDIGVLDDTAREAAVEIEDFKSALRKITEPGGEATLADLEKTAADDDYWERLTGEDERDLEGY